jgi:hypothetical protein
MEYALPADEIDICEKFASQYELYQTHPMDLTKEPLLPPKKLWTCRFCGRGAQTTTFKGTPHRFSRFLCNPYLIWDEECHNCNATFGRYERELGQWLGVHRVFSDIRPGNKRFIFSSSDGSVESRRLGNLILVEQTGPGGFKGTLREGEIEVNTTRLPYTPAKVYQAFLKNALSALPKSDLVAYRLAMATLRHEQFARSASGFRIIKITESNLSAEHPLALVYRRTSTNHNLPLHICCLYVRNFLFQIPLPLEKEGLMAGITKFEMPPAPLVAKHSISDVPFEFIRNDCWLEGWAEETPVNEKLVLRPDPEALKHLVSVPLPPDFLENLKKQP